MVTELRLQSKSVFTPYITEGNHFIIFSDIWVLFFIIEENYQSDLIHLKYYKQPLFLNVSFIVWNQYN